MKTFAVLSLCLAASVSAFAPSSCSTSSSSRSTSSTSSSAAVTVVITQPVVAHTTLHALVDSAFGVSIETGNKVPPLGRKILEDAGPDGVKWFQNAEIKHGRIAMVAVIGFWVQKLGVHFPLYLGPSGSNGFHPSEAHNWFLSTTTGMTFQDIAQASPLEAVSMVPEQGWAQIFLVAGWFECIAYQKQWADAGADTIPGDYGYDPLGFTKKEGGIAGKDFESLRLKEIKNGRVAMLTIAAWVSNECIPGALPTWHP